jgi:hypothetical protein
VSNDLTNSIRSLKLGGKQSELKFKINHDDWQYYSQSGTKSLLIEFENDIGPFLQDKKESTL